MMKRVVGCAVLVGAMLLAANSAQAQSIGIGFGGFGPGYRGYGPGFGYGPGVSMRIGPSIGYTRAGYGAYRPSYGVYSPSVYSRYGSLRPSVYSYPRVVPTVTVGRPAYYGYSRGYYRRCR